MTKLGLMALGFAWLLPGLVFPKETSTQSNADPTPAMEQIQKFLNQPILEKGLTLAQLRSACERRYSKVPTFTKHEDYQKYANDLRREILEKIVFRGTLAKTWRDAKTRVEWLDTIPGGPGYQIRKVRYEAMPGMWIPALLYQPETNQTKRPVHLAFHGHDPLGKAAPYKQIRCINLAKRGITSLSLGWFGMGQLRGEGYSHGRVNELDLCGESGLAPFYLTMSRGLDLLLALPNADPSRVGVSGLSGGGWQTIWLSALDTRVTLCNPVAGYTSLPMRAIHPGDMGDAEQMPNDFGTLADYTHLTALLAGRHTLLTYNSKDDCCFQSAYALQPLLDAAQPAFRLNGQPLRLRWHINHTPGTHNDEIDNRQAFYRLIGDSFYPGDSTFDPKEIPSEKELKKPGELHVPLPENNLDLHRLALMASSQLPRLHGGESKDNLQALRRDLAKTVAMKEWAPSATLIRKEISGKFSVDQWKIQTGKEWTIPVTVFTPKAPKGTTILLADSGRKTQAKEVWNLLQAGQRVLAVDLLGFGECQLENSTPLYFLLLSCVGDRPLGVQTSQLHAVSQWSQKQFSDLPTVKLVGKRTGLIAMVAKALSPDRLGAIQADSRLKSLKDLIQNNLSQNQYPECFCFGLLECLDIPQLEKLAQSPTK